MDHAIIFDVDGTLAETEETHRRAFNQAFRKAGLVWHWGQELYRELLAETGGKERIRHFIDEYRASGVPTENPDAFVRALHAEKTSVYTQMVRGGELRLRPGVRAFIHSARELGYRLAIATTTTPANVDALLTATFGECGVSMFEVVCAGDSVANKKPAPDVYLRTLEELGLAGRDCIAIEDSRNGLLAAHAAGIATIVTPSTYTRDENFDEAGLVIGDLASLDVATLESLFR